MESDKEHIMVDIETEDTVPSAVILSIGAVDMATGVKQFYRELDTYTQHERTSSDSTKDWWAAQINKPAGLSGLSTTLKEFTIWLESFDKPPVIWCKGTDFDVAILSHAYNQLKLPIPWKYNDIRDCRTVFKLARISVSSASHYAIRDAIDQRLGLLESLDILGVSTA
jgi:hypothetical protein